MLQIIIRMAFPLIPILLAAFVLYLLRMRYHAGMNKFDGPLLASFTDLWKVWHAWRNGSNPIYVDIHKKYGDIVRVGPNELSFANPKAIHEIYGARGINQKVCTHECPNLPDQKLTFLVKRILCCILTYEWRTRRCPILDHEHRMARSSPSTRLSRLFHVPDGNLRTMYRQKHFSSH